MFEGRQASSRSTLRRSGGLVRRWFARCVTMNGTQATGAIRFLAGRDTRESGAWIERELAFGIRSQGGSLTSAGVVPTPAIAYLTPRTGYSAGVVISASHNPFEDNGIKVFSGAGEKFTETLERRSSRSLLTASWSVPADASSSGRGNRSSLRVSRSPAGHPARRAIARTGMRIAIDCANGATATVAPRLFREMGFEVSSIGASPDGRNINLGCGSTAPDTLGSPRRRGSITPWVSPSTATAIARSSSTRQDASSTATPCMLMCAKQMKAEGRLKGKRDRRDRHEQHRPRAGAARCGIGMVRCAVGDKYVMEEMMRRDLSLGGEQSGHIIFSEYLFTGDGLATALNVLRTMSASRRELGDLADRADDLPSGADEPARARRRSI